MDQFPVAINAIIAAFICSDPNIMHLDKTTIELFGRMYFGHLPCFIKNGVFSVGTFFTISNYISIIFGDVSFKYNIARYEVFVEGKNRTMRFKGNKGFLYTGDSIIRLYDHQIPKIPYDFISKLDQTGEFKLHLIFQPIIRTLTWDQAVKQNKQIGWLQ